NLAFQFFIPAEAATIPIIIPKSQLLTANALFYLVLTFSSVLGYTISGPLVNHLGERYIFILAALAMFTGLALRRTLPPLASQIPQGARSLSQQPLREVWQLTIAYISEGFHYLHQN